MIEELYISLFVKCQKCGEKINSNDGYWTWENYPELKGGYYHPQCGMINNPASKELLPFKP